MPVGFAEGLSHDPKRPDWDGKSARPLRWTLWYPAEDDAVERPPTAPSWFRAESVAVDAPLRRSVDAYPLVLVSHGTGGVAAGLGWLGCRLARLGFVVLAVDHHGNTGTEPYRAEGFLCLWERASDLSALLDDDTWRRRLSGAVATTCSVAGFSAGAYAAMLLLGARIRHTQFEPGNPMHSPHRGPREFPDLANEVSRLLAESAVFRDSWERRGADFSDPRVDAALLLAPGRSVLGFEPQSLAQLRTPVRILVGDGDSIAPAIECAGWLHRHLQSSQLQIVEGGAGHYVFLPEGSESGLSEVPDLFVDAEGVDRRAIHNSVGETAVRLFRDAKHARRIPAE